MLFNKVYGLARHMTVHREAHSPALMILIMYVVFSVSPRERGSCELKFKVHGLSDSD